MSQQNEPVMRHYEREAETTRHSLANSLNELGDRLTPGQVFDEMLSYAKGGSGTFYRAFSNAVRENPVPSLLIGAGCMMFLSERMEIGKKHVVARDFGRDGAYEAQGKPGAGISDAVKERASQAAEGMKQGIAAVKGSIEEATQRAREKAHDMTDGVSEAVEQIRQTADSARERVSDKAARAGEQTMNAGRQIREQASSLIQEQPMLMAGIGLAVGAAIAALLPSTKVEDELLGETSDSIKRQIGKTAAQQFETAKHTAGEVVEKTKDIAEREGITSAGVAANIVEKFSSNDQRDPRGVAVREETERESDEMNDLAFPRN